MPGREDFYRAVHRSAPKGKPVGTHNGFRSHGRFRCLVFLFRRTYSPGFGRYLPEDLSGCRAESTRRALTAFEKWNGESENPRGTSESGGRERQRPWLKLESCEGNGELERMFGRA